MNFTTKVSKELIHELKKIVKNKKAKKKFELKLKNDIKSHKLENLNKKGNKQ